MHRPRELARPLWSRRSFARAAVAGVGGAATGVLGAPAPVHATAPRVLLLGDSMIQGAVGRFLENELAGAQGWTVHRHGKTSSGLARPDFYDWVEQGGRSRSRGGPWTAVVCMFGGNDGQGLYRPARERASDAERDKWIRWGEPGWTELYRSRVNAFADAVTAGGEYLFWIGMPVMGPARLHARMRELNVIYRGEMAVRPRAEFIDIWRTLAGPGGEYVDALGSGERRRRIRAHDGVHLNANGAMRVVREVVPVMQARLGVVPRDDQPSVE